MSFQNIIQYYRGPRPQLPLFGFVTWLPLYGFVHWLPLFGLVTRLPLIWSCTPAHEHDMTKCHCLFECNTQLHYKRPEMDFYPTYDVHSLYRIWISTRLKAHLVHTYLVTIFARMHGNG